MRVGEGTTEVREGDFIEHRHASHRQNINLESRQFSRLLAPVEHSLCNFLLIFVRPSLYLCLCDIRSSPEDGKVQDPLRLCRRRTVGIAHGEAAIEMSKEMCWCLR